MDYIEKVAYYPCVYVYPFPQLQLTITYITSASQDGISELHGNSNREYCKDCGKDYIRGKIRLEVG
jgi:hypothetical protein